MPTKNFKCECGEILADYTTYGDNPNCGKCGKKMEWYPGLLPGQDNFLKTIGPTSESHFRDRKVNIKPFDNGRRKDESDALGHL